LTQTDSDDEKRLGETREWLARQKWQLPDRPEGPSDFLLRLLDTEREKSARLERAFYELRHLLDDRNPNGKTIVDFLNVWLDQEKARATAAEAQLAEMRRALELADDVLSRFPYSAELWPNGTHPNAGIAQIRAALSPKEPDHAG
jgi:hypothetical protein